MKLLRFAIVLGAAVALSACSINIESDDEIPEARDLDDMQARDYDFAGFTRIEINTAAQLIFTQDSDTSVRLLTEDDHFDDLILELDGDSLILDHDGRHRGDRHVRLEIHAPNLEALNVDGVIDGRFENLSLDHLSIEISGAGNLEIEGTCLEANYYIRGAGNIEARDFECESVIIDMAGAGNAELYASHEIEIEVAGVGNVEVWGNPTVRRQDVFGLGDVDIKSD